MSRVEDVPTTDGDSWGRSTNHSRRVEAVAPIVAKAIADWCFGKGEKYWSAQILAADPATRELEVLRAVARQMREALENVREGEVSLTDRIATREAIAAFDKLQGGR